MGSGFWKMVLPNNETIVADDFGVPVIIDDKLFFKVKDGPGWLVYNKHEGKSRGPYEQVGDPIKINGEVVFWAKKGNTYYVIHEDGREEYLCSALIKGRVFNIPGGMIGIDTPTGHTPRERKFYVAYPKFMEVYTGDYQRVYDAEAIDGKVAAILRLNDFRKQRVFSDGRADPPQADIYQFKAVPEQSGFFHTTLEKNFQVIAHYPDCTQKRLGRGAGIGLDFVSLHKRIHFFKEMHGLWHLVREGDEDTPLLTIPVPQRKQAPFLSAEDGYVVISFQDGNKQITYGKKIEEIAKPQDKAKIDEQDLKGIERPLFYLRQLHQPFFTNPDGTWSRNINENLVPNFWIWNRIHWSKTDTKESLQDRLSRSPGVASVFQRWIQDAPQEFAGKLPAVADDLSDANIDRILHKLFPEAFLRSPGRGEGVGRRRTSNPPSVESSFTDNAEISFMSGDPREARREILFEFREPIYGMLVRNILSQFDASTKKWRELEFPIDQTLIDPIREHTAKVPEAAIAQCYASGMKELLLPCLFGAKILHERIRGVTFDGAEIPLETREKTFGRVLVTLPSVPRIKEILISQTVSELPHAVPELSAQRYLEFMRGFAKTHPKVFAALCEPLFKTFSPEFALFLERIRNLAPHEKVMAIEDLVHRIFYYDEQNGEILGSNDEKPIEEKLVIMQERMQDLRRRYPERAKDFEGKKYAGVCLEANELTVALLRAAGMPAGIVDGFMAKGHLVVTRGHVEAFTLFPGEGGKARLFEVDGTPSGDPSKNLSLAERARAIEQKTREMGAWAEDRLIEVGRLLDREDIKAIAQLTNGQLESLVNQVERVIQESHVARMEQVLHAVAFTPYFRALPDLVSNEGIRKGFRAFVSNVAVKPFAEGPLAGASFVQTVSDFLRRLKDSLDEKNKPRAFTLARQMTYFFPPELETEKKMFVAIVTYLEAKSMVGKNK